MQFSLYDGKKDLTKGRETSRAANRSNPTSLASEKQRRRAGRGVLRTYGQFERYGAGKRNCWQASGTGDVTAAAPINRTLLDEIEEGTGLGKRNGSKILVKRILVRMIVRDIGPMTSGQYPLEAACRLVYRDNDNLSYPHLSDALSYMDMGLNPDVVLKEWKWTYTMPFVFIETGSGVTAADQQGQHHGFFQMEHKFPKGLLIDYPDSTGYPNQNLWLIVTPVATSKAVRFTYCFRVEYKEL